MENIIVRGLDKLEKIEREYGMIGTIFGVIIILTTMVLSVIAIKYILQFNFKVIDWVCREFFRFKLL